MAVSSLAAALAAKAEPVDELPDLTAAPAAGWLVARPSNFIHRDIPVRRRPLRTGRHLGPFDVAGGVGGGVVAAG